jgi:manganese/zinc/iron transport system substrate-binding protein
MRARICGALLAMALGAGGALADGPAQVLATTGMIGDVARTVAGDCATVDVLMAPGVDPHLFKASAGDVRALQRAELILFSGYSLEGQLGDVLDKLGRQKPTLAVAEAAVPAAELITAQDGHGIDPHVWMDASLWQRTARVIAAAVGEVAPDCAPAMAERAEAYEAELAALHHWIATSVATIPEPQRILVTAHDAFSYYGRAYGIEVAGIQGISTESEAGIADIRAMVDAVVARRVPAVFIESTINPRTVQAVIDAAAARGHALRMGGELYADAMGAEGMADGTFIGMLVANTRAIVAALGGRLAPLPEVLRPWAERWNVVIAADATRRP